MTITRPALAVILCGTALLCRCNSPAQELADPRSNAIDPGALTTAPAFGNSAPSRRSSGLTPTEEAPPKAESSDESLTDWRPRFRIQLFGQNPNTGTAPDSATGLDLLAVPEVGSPVNPSDVRTSGEDLIMLSDNVSLDARKSSGGELLYSLSCPGRMILTADGVKISGRDCRLEDEELTIHNAEVITQQVTMQAARITLKLKLAGVAVNSVDSPPPTEKKVLTPVPDTIGESESSLIAPEKPNAGNPPPGPDPTDAPKEN